MFMTSGIAIGWSGCPTAVSFCPRKKLFQWRNGFGELLYFRFASVEWTRWTHVPWWQHCHLYYCYYIITYCFIGSYFLQLLLQVMACLECWGTQVVTVIIYTTVIDNRVSTNAAKRICSRFPGRV